MSSNHISSCMIRLIIKADDFLLFPVRERHTHTHTALVTIIIDSYLNITGSRPSTPCFLSETRKSTTFVPVFVRCEMKSKKELSSSGNAVVSCWSFLLFVCNSCSSLSWFDADVVDATEYMMHRCSNI